jgi:HAE1 family hydrophobic/amphiphilic exporter-1
MGGIKQEVAESFGGLFIAFILAVILVYMIMAAGFESLLHPFLIMVTVPLGIIGVACIILLTFTPVSTPVILGIVLLGGIVVNNGIVLIDHINFLRKEEGKELMEATVSGCVNRLRPVLMTALVTILSLIPVALGIGQGTEMSSPMAIATFGGLLVATVLTLLVLPVLYVMVEERRSLRTAPAPARLKTSGPGGIMMPE